ncbi:hypothetical protein DFH07DRAFT_772224 [Mycena maculata]|uniref:Uncharacterized protein n=1 Tax=Mycena maculata TaxID=230809 RepID=A0AAD7JA48_9AGAR|nr:hypothetical protein DFH07DRAFT_772224 [Mycena maculata]
MFLEHHFMQYCLPEETWAQEVGISTISARTTAPQLFFSGPMFLLKSLKYGPNRGDEVHNSGRKAQSEQEMCTNPLQTRAHHPTSSTLEVLVPISLSISLSRNSVDSRTAITEHSLEMDSHTSGVERVGWGTQNPRPPRIRAECSDDDQSRGLSVRLVREREEKQCGGEGSATSSITTCSVMKCPHPAQAARTVARDEKGKGEAGDGRSEHVHVHSANAHPRQFREGALDTIWALLMPSYHAPCTPSTPTVARRPNAHTPTRGPGVHCMPYPRVAATYPCPCGPQSSAVLSVHVGFGEGKAHLVHWVWIVQSGNRNCSEKAISRCAGEVGGWRKSNADERGTLDRITQEAQRGGGPRDTKTVVHTQNSSDWGMSMPAPMRHRHTLHIYRKQTRASTFAACIYEDKSETHLKRGWCLSNHRGRIDREFLRQDIVFIVKRMAVTQSDAVCKPVGCWLEGSPAESLRVRQRFRCRDDQHQNQDPTSTRLRVPPSIPGLRQIIPTVHPGTSLIAEEASDMKVADTDLGLLVTAVRGGGTATGPSIRQA